MRYLNSMATKNDLMYAHYAFLYITMLYVVVLRITLVYLYSEKKKQQQSL